MDTKKTEELTFKDASVELEQIVRKLEGGTDLELEVFGSVCSWR